MEDFVAQLIASVRGIWHHRWHAVVVAWAVALLGWARVYTLPDEYQSTARVFVDTQSILKPLLAGMTTVPNVEQQVAIMSRTLLSRPNVERVMRMVDLDLKAVSPRDHEQQIDELMNKIKISGTSTYDIYTITYHNRNPRLVRDVVQSLLTIFVEGSFKGKKGESDKAVQFIDEQIRVYEEKLLAAENAVKEFKLRNAGVLPQQGIEYASQLAMATDALNNARLELQEAEQARNAISAQVTGDEPILGVESRPADIVNPELDARIAALNRNLDTLRLQYTELHPDIIATRHLIEQLEERKVKEARAAPVADPGKSYSPLLQQLKVAQTEADARVASMKARVQEYAARHERLLAQMNAVPEIESQLAQLNRDYQVNKDNYEKLISKREAAKLSGELSSTTEMMTFKIIDPPTLPLAPIGPNRNLLYSAVFLAAMLAGPAAALALSQIRPTFLGPAAMRATTGLAVLGTVGMNWTPEQRTRRRRGTLLFGAAGTALAVAYGAVLAANFWKG
ncbi:MAG TPA: XrtA system polysaccharide chain length determinant [Telluria sp.]|nr:XrtA system polysaccharide chain length determinant [Telluria sp.]